MKKYLALTVTLGIVLTSCEKDDGPETPTEPSGAYENGILVSNEGPFENGTGTVSFIPKDSIGTEASIFNKVNGEHLGNIVQSIGFEDDTAYIVANVSNKITVVDRYTFEKIATIEEGLSNPRYFTAVNGKGYVTNWGDSADESDDFVAVINLDTYVVDSTIPVIFGPEKILANANSVYVAHKGGFGFNNQISAINVAVDTVTTTIEVGDVPDSMQVGADGNLWVLSSGKPGYADTETSGVLSKIDMDSNQVTATFEFPNITDHPRFLCEDADNFYYVSNGAVYTFQSDATALPTEPLLADVNFYTMEVFEGKLFGTDAKDFASNGELNSYDLGNALSKQTFTVGIIPGGIYLNN